MQGIQVQQIQAGQAHYFELAKVSRSFIKARTVQGIGEYSTTLRIFSAKISRQNAHRNDVVPQR